MIQRILNFTILTVLATGSLSAESDRAVDYIRDIKPLLRNKCSTCHGVLKQEAGLRLDAGAMILEGAVVEPGDPGDSELIHRITAKDKDIRMPLDGKPLTADQIALLKAWISQGAKFPADEEIGVAPEQHWAFQKIVRPDVPDVADGDWPLNPIDHFVLARLESKGWTPNPSAPVMSLLRRAHLDLIGLPPTLQEQDRFAANPHFDELVADLLRRPGYGERYARHWLDVARYADSNGYERDAAKPEVWRYRDYVIRALNADKPFDRFLQEQIAGDELDDATTETVIATGFHRLGPWDDEPADFAVDRFDQLDDIVNTTSQAFLALTMGCARCHNHKFDPLLHTDYYSMVAIFNPLKRVQSGRTDQSRYAAPPAMMARLVERDQKIAVENAAIARLRDEFAQEFLKAARSQLPADVQAAFLAVEQDRSDAQKKLVKDNRGKLHEESAATLTPEQTKRIADHEATIAGLRKETPDVPHGYFMYEPSPIAPETRLLKRGNPKTPGEVVPAAVPAILVDEQPALLEPTQFTSRRRLTLANWMVQPDNPLTARVIVNRVWQWHFGSGIVGTANDFGLIGDRPTHPLLLDWLAHWFVHDAKWSFRKLHHLVMTSRTYQMSGHTREALQSVDPDNRLLWRRVPRRLEVEAIRDSMLFVSGRLDRKMYGPPMYPFVPREALLNHADKTKIWPEFNEDAASRRTVYAFIKRSLLIPLLEVLDLCDVTQTSPQRNVTTVPTQALTLYNGNFAMRQSRHFADRLLREADEKPADQIRLAFRLALARPPSDVEQAAMMQFLAMQYAEGDRQSSGTDRSVQALTQLCRVIFNLNEFVYPE
jgi:hypothetical protein